MRLRRNYDKIAFVSVEEATFKSSVAGNETASPTRPWESPWVWLALLFVLQLGSPYLPIPNRAVAIAAFLITTLLYVIGVVLFIVHGTRVKPNAAILVAGMLGCGLLWWLLDRYGMPALFEPIRAAQKARQRPAPDAVLMFQVARVTADAALLGASVMGGGLVARLIKTPNMLGPICAVVAMIDIWGVLFSGPVAQMIEKAPELAQKAMPSLPAAGALSKGAQYAISPLQIGVGDYLFLGLLFAALHLNGMNWRGAAKLAIPFIFVTLILVLFVGHMPGLLPIGLAIALPNLKYFQYTRDEKFALLWAGIFVIILSIGAYFGVQRALPEKPNTPQQMRNSPATEEERP